MTRLLTSPVGFLVSYLALMIPTYLLPYAGSNSSIINGVSAIMGRGPTPMWWMHFWCLFMLILVAHVRGQLLGKGFLLAFPLIALVFDLTPGLSSIPLVPTFLHLLCLILGAMGATVPAAEGAPAIGFGGTVRTGAGVTLAAVVGMLWFALGLTSPATPRTPVAMPATGAGTSPAKPPALAMKPPTPPVAQAQEAAPSTVSLSAQAAPRPPAPKPLEPKTAKPAGATPSKSDTVDKPTVRMINIREP